MYRRIIGWVVLVPLCAVLVIFALANRQLVVLNFNPFVSVEQITAPGYGVPLFLVLYVVLLVGVLLGGVATWFSQGEHRRRERHWRREATALGSELEAQRKTPGTNPSNSLSEVDDLMDLR
ncbi:lipopolysaccharide assembly protein LapA domain-containing protein [Devosia rhodophyticola]|uniref:Lipopolysaccharide assembly protein LapA domain-containing protein n=1 Tax=Devosia rhodophyticola TaxID=3026423 RepID=A0ABY7Z0X2_9HYPH|nr:lipopolysaccharide assembly protein LapA domain-containing protein [Devosia rhodophyticola]WDR07171.1 lipopolysaccharide assembly protein LapA domain-containing protein [Devosia rhodophyticola]